MVSTTPLLVKKKSEEIQIVETDKKNVFCKYLRNLSPFRKQHFALCIFCHNWCRFWKGSEWFFRL